MQSDAPVEIVAYDPIWPVRFLEERNRLLEALQDILAGLPVHIGSTAVPGLAAKPVIDIMAPVRSLPESEAAIGRVAPLGYQHYPYKPELMHWFCKPSPVFCTHHLHLVPVGSRLWDERLAFRDALRAEGAWCTEYRALKERLALRYRHDRDAYTDAKTPFVQRILESVLPRPGMPRPPEPSVHPLGDAAWREWLEANHGRMTGVWLVSYKKATGKPRVDYDAAVAIALCFGWIDSKPNKLDDERTMLWFAPRQRGSGWSRPNKIRVERMMQAGSMAESGLRKIEEAKRDGSWFRLDAIEDRVVPDDLSEALGRYPDAAVNFEAFPRSARRGILEWITNAKMPQTRARRVDETARMASANERANQWRPKKPEA
jgi:GrpB-like predicted nucleotidyltransferase (UPF0157 family)/uncharacterized protein YdeI (YjbR/CyaY-like superfamily)